MQSRDSTWPEGGRRIQGSRRHVAVALAAALLFISLFVDVGVARAEYPVGWEDPDLGEVGACLITCGAFWTSTGPVAKYGLGAGCIGCAWKLFGEVNDWMQTFDAGNCYTGILGQPCGSREYQSL